MIFVTRLAAQGDVLFRRITALPENLVEVPCAGPMVVAHSETGHHHCVFGTSVRLFEKVQRDPLLCYLQIDGDSADAIHERGFGAHETLRLAPGAWEVRRQREWTGGQLWRGSPTDSWSAVLD